MVPCRATPVLASTDIATTPMPVPLPTPFTAGPAVVDVTRAHDTLLDAVHAQVEELAVTVKVSEKLEAGEGAARVPAEVELNGKLQVETQAGATVPTPNGRVPLDFWLSDWLLLLYEEILRPVAVCPPARPGLSS